MFRIITKYPIISHILFWVGVLILDSVESEKKHGLYPGLIMGLSIIIVQIMASYLTVYYLIPYYFKKKKYLQFTVYFVLSAYLLCVLCRILVVHVAEPFVRTPPFHQESISEIFRDLYWLTISYFPSIYVMVGFFWLVTFLDFSRKNLSLQKQKSEAELKVLKSQLNPHFLFNTLNNIYSLSLDNSPKTSESIGKLSAILDYVLYRCEDDFVPLSGEIKVVEDYIALEKLRYDDRLKLTFEKKLEAEKEIAPLILLSLVENAFKHGAGEDGGSPSIHILISSTSKEFKFIIENSVVETSIHEKKDSIGLGNIRKQLDLLYPNSYDFYITRLPKSFKVILNLYT